MICSDHFETTPFSIHLSAFEDKPQFIFSVEY